MDRALDVIVIGAGIGGIVALHYARKAGLDALLLERQGTVGGLWAQLPPWQDIQFGRADWTLGDLPIAGEDQASIRDNIQAWVDRFGLADAMRLGTPVTQARRVGDLWHVETPARTYRARYLFAATGAHNRPIVPNPVRTNVALGEFHSSALRDARSLTGRDVVVVGGGASAYDLLDLCFEYDARSVTWVYRRTRWMMPTGKPKAQSGGPRALAKAQMSGATSEQISRALHADMSARYAKLGLQDILPDEPFHLGRHQLIPGRWRMIANYPKIRRHRSEVVRVSGRRVVLVNEESFDADLLLWGTGYEVDLSYFANPALSGIRRQEDLAAQCGSGVLAMAERGLYLMAANLDSTGTAPWSYALMARTIMSHIQGHATLEPVPFARKVNHFDYPAFLAARDPLNFPADRWESEYRQLATEHPIDRPLPIPD